MPSSRQREVVITGIGPILPGCDSRAGLWGHLRDGCSQLSLAPNPAAPARRCAMGRIEGFDAERYLGAFPRNYYERYGRDVQLFLASLVRACEDADLRPATLPADRIGLYTGSSRSNFALWYDLIRQEQAGQPESVYGRDLLSTGMPGQAVGVAASLLKIKGPTYTFTGMCTAAGIALGHAMGAIQRGEIDVALASGYDAALVAPVYQMYLDADLLSEEVEDPRRAVRPYVEHSRNAFGEGAVTLVLEARRHAEARGAPILATLASYCYGNNGDHPTHVDASGQRPAELIRDALREARLEPQQVRFVIGHGNAVPASDLSEIRYMKAIFADRVAQVPLLSTKPIFGHTFGASAAVSAAAAALMVHHRYIIPTANVEPGVAASGCNHQGGTGQADPCGAGLVMAFAIGGQNCALVVKRPATEEDDPLEELVWKRLAPDRTGPSH